MSTERLDALLALQQQQLTSAEAQLLQAPGADSREFRGGINRIYAVQLQGGARGFFKPADGVSARVARDYGHEPNETLIHECAAWQLAKALGPPYNRLVATCVWREFDGVWGTVAGSLSEQGARAPRFSSSTTPPAIPTSSLRSSR